MRITKIEVQKKRAQRHSVYVDGKFVIGIDQETYLHLGLREGDEITKAKLNEIINYELKLKAKESALNLLSYRGRSKKELSARLQKKEVEPKLIVETLQELEAAGLINDLEFAKAWVRERGESRGPFKLRSELIAKGVPKEIIDEALSECPPESEIAQKLTQKWLATHQYLPQDTLKRRLFSFLLRRGLNYETIKSLDIFK